METRQKHWISKFKLKIKLEIKNHHQRHAPGLPPGAVIQRARAAGARVGMVFRAAAA